MNLADKLRHHARRRGTLPAIVSRTQEVTYAQLDVAVDNIVEFLEQSGIKKNDVLGLSLGDTAQHVAFLFAIARMGAIILPIDRRWTDVERARVATHFEAHCVLVDQAVAEAPYRSLLVPTELSFEQSGNPRESARDDSGDLPLAFSLSSGTTGRPKGPLITHRNLYERFITYYVTATLNEHDRFACTSPMYFGGSRGFGMSILYAGATLVLLPPPVEPLRLIEEINELGCTSAFMVPTVVRRLLDIHDKESLCFPNLRLLLCTGSALYPGDRREAMRRIASNIISFYGSTEGGGISALMSHHPPEKAASAGRVVFGTDVRIVNANFEDVPAGEIGRVAYKSGGTAACFHNDPEATALSFRNGWFQPGDLGYIDRDGFVFITGREKDMIIRGGVNIYPNEIESILVAHPGVKEVAVVGVPSEKYGEEVVAVITSQTAVDEAQLAAFCAGQLAPYKVPSAFELIGEMPRTSMGKIDKQALKQALNSNSGIRTSMATHAVSRAR
jgi:long-chain acyl-CoA synthetase